MNQIILGQRVYHRRADLFGTIVLIESGYAHVKYEWPYDPDAEARCVPVSELQDAYEVEMRYL